LILLRNIILLRKSQLVTSYTLKLDVNRYFWNPAWSKCKHVISVDCNDFDAGFLITYRKI
jgi:hypothetical protein